MNYYNLKNKNNTRDNERKKIENGEFMIFFKKYKKEFDYYHHRFGTNGLLSKYHSIIDEFGKIKQTIVKCFYELKNIKINKKKLKFSKNFLLNGVRLSIFITKTDKKHTTENSYIGETMHIHKKYKDMVKKGMDFSGLCVSADDLIKTVLYYNFEENKILYFMVPDDFDENYYNIDKFILKHKKYKNKNDFIYYNCKNKEKIGHCIKIKEGITFMKDSLCFSETFDLSFLGKNPKNKDLLNLLEEFEVGFSLDYDAILYGAPISNPKNNKETPLFYIKCNFFLSKILLQKENGKCSCVSLFKLSKKKK